MLAVPVTVFIAIVVFPFDVLTYEHFISIVLTTLTIDALCWLSEMF